MASNSVVVKCYFNYVISRAVPIILIFLTIILFRISPVIPKDCPIILRKLSGGSCDSTILHN